MQCGGVRRSRQCDPAGRAADHPTVTFLLRLLMILALVLATCKSELPALVSDSAHDRDRLLATAALSLPDSSKHRSDRRDWPRQSLPVVTV